MIRPATADDERAITALVERAYARYIERIGRRPAPMDDDYAALIGAGEVFVLDENGRIAGIVVLRAAAGHLLVDNVAVDPRLQGRGHGGDLLAFAEARATALRLPELRLYTNTAMTENIEAYRHLGWREYDRSSSSGFARVYFRKPVGLSA